TIAQATYTHSGEAFIADLTESLERGNEAIVYDGKSKITWTPASLTQLSELILDYPIYAFDLASDDNFINVFYMINKEDRQHVQGKQINLPEGYKNLRTISLDARQVHLNGSDIITELAVILAKAAEAAEDYDNFKAFESQVIVRFAVDTEFFLEISKLRAFRIL